MEQRPDPEKLLHRIQEEELLNVRGKLKIYLGAAPGVGKTYAMLSDALAKKSQNVNVIIGIVETHGRSEVDTLAKKLEKLPRTETEYHGHLLQEFDLDAAIKKNPSIILIDEMAHTNVPGTRHTKRWQDIKELLDLGIDVYTTLNVQHIESLNDVVSQIIHAPIKETVPDFMLERADSIELVDLPTEELLKRLQEGKVYIPKQAELAAEHFFRKGNLNALRELALRVTAERVDAQLMRYRQGEGIHYIWPIKEKILVCIGNRAESGKLIRVAKRMATKLQAELIAVHVESPLSPLSEEAHAEVTHNMRLAEKLGAETYILNGIDVVKEIINFAHEHNVTMIVVWKQIRPRWKDFLFKSLADELTRYSGEIDTHVITSEKDHMKPLVKISLEPEEISKKPWWLYLFAFSTVLLATLLNLTIFYYTNLSVVIIIYLLSVMIVTIFGELKPALFASVLSVVGCNYFFISPYYSVFSENYLANVTLGSMFFVLVAISFYSTRFRYQVISARQSQHHTQVLHALSRQLASTRGKDKLLGAAVHYISEMFDSDVIALCMDEDQLMIKVAYGTEPVLNEKEYAVAQWVYDLGQIAGKGTETLPFSDAFYVPMLASHHTLGVLRIHHLENKVFTPEQMHLLELCATQIAIALEVERLEEHVRKSEVEIEANQIRSALLQSFSHDLRTPLVAVLGAASTLKEMGTQLKEGELQKISNTIYFELTQLNRLINNLLQMANLEAEMVHLNIVANSLKEVIEVAVDTLTKKTRNKNINIMLPEDVATIPFDYKLILEVFINLLDNAIKFTPRESEIDITVVQKENEIVVCVLDRGPGIVFDEVDKLFEKFYRGRQLTTERGLGLGLAICHRIIKAHKGKIWAENRQDGGAKFCFTLPISVEHVNKIATDQV